MSNNNLDKATKITELIIKLDYNDNLNEFQEENGYKEGFTQEVFFWLEDGHGDGYSVDECRLRYEL